MTPLQQLREKTLRRLGEYQPLLYRLPAPMVYLAGWASLGILPLLAMVSRSRAMAAWLGELLADLVTLLRASGRESADLWRLEKVAGHLAAQRGHGRMALIMALISLVLAVLLVPSAVAMFLVGRGESLLWRTIVLLLVFGGSWVLLLYAAYGAVQNTLRTQYRLLDEAVGHLSAISESAGAGAIERPEAEEPTPPWLYVAALTYLPTVWGVVMMRQAHRWSLHCRRRVRGLIDEIVERFDAMIIQPGADATLVLPEEAPGDSRVCPDPQCGAANPREAAFCKRCGRRLDEEIP